ncbi:MAG: hypothetical protein ACFFA0_05015 [Promethearchaeota archaeon]
MMKNKRELGCLILLCFVLSGLLGFFSLKLENNSEEFNNPTQINTSAQESFIRQWIDNPNFTSTDNWTFSKGMLGDPNDLDAYISNEEANYEVLGFEDRFTFEEKYNMGPSWVETNHPDYPIDPDFGNIVAGEGFRAEHSWDDQNANQVPSVQWEHNFTLPVNMSDYTITSASVSAGVNATVDSNIDTENDYPSYTARTDGYLVDTFSVGDYIRFYVSISNLQKTKTYEIAHTQSATLGDGNAGSTDNLAQQLMSTVSQADLVYYISSVLETDYRNFTLIVGIRFNCEDNVGTYYDLDDFNRAVINSINLTFAYEKKIQKLSTISWNQVGIKPNDLSSDTVVVDEALLGFKYKINDTWPTSSPNSEIRININDNKHSETVKLSSATTSPQDAKLEGFDVTYLIDEDENINLSIQVYIADDFKLNRSIKISIDEVYLNISYTVIFADYITNLELYLNGEDKTSSPSITVPIGQNVTITVKYTNQTGGHISEAGIQLTGVGIIENLEEQANNYSITINVTQQLSMGPNSLNIEAVKTNFETRIINPTIIVRQIDTEILTISGVPNINIDEGQNAQLEIILNDTDNNELIKGAIVTYTWDLDSIPRVLTEDDGVYEGIIEEPPEGLYTITISAYAGENYEFEDFEITLNVGAYVPGTQPDLSWLIYTLIGAILGLVLIFTLYQTHFKYPPMIRKIRKLKKKIGKDKKTKPIILSKRDEIVQKKFQSHTNTIGVESKLPEEQSKDKKIKK